MERRSKAKSKPKAKNDKYLRFLMAILTAIGVTLVGLGLFTLPLNMNPEYVTTRINILAFSMGFIYLVFVFVMYKKF